MVGSAAGGSSELGAGAGLAVEASPLTADSSVLPTSSLDGSKFSLGGSGFVSGSAVLLD